MKYNSLKEKRVIDIMDETLGEINYVLAKIQDICEDVDSGKLRPCKAKKMYKPYNERMSILTGRVLKMIEEFSYLSVDSFEDYKNRVYNLSEVDVMFNHYLLS